MSKHLCDIKSRRVNMCQETLSNPYLWTTKEEWVWLAKGGWQTRVNWGVVRAAITDKPGFPKIERVWDRKGVEGGRVFSSDSSEKPLKDCQYKSSLHWFAISVGTT